jgi:predicted ATPase
MLAITSVAARADPMVGRRFELEQLDAALEALAAGAPACLAVEGEPGIGKTRLLRELRCRAEERGDLVLSGSAAEFERDLPYGVWWRRWTPTSPRRNSRCERTWTPSS